MREMTPPTPREDPRGPTGESLLLLVVLGLALFFVATSFLTRRFRVEEARLAETWSRRGESALASGRPTEAAEALRTALVYARGNPRYRLKLAEALKAVDRPAEARAHLESLWEEEPGDGPVNLELARLAVRLGMPEEAERYFHNAIFGLWTDHAEARRRESRLELVEFLLDRGSLHSAQAELISLADEVPADADLHARVGGLFLRAGDADRALAEYRKALALDPRTRGALLGAGEAALRSGGYALAERYLREAHRQAPDDPRASDFLATTRDVMERDPTVRGLSARERGGRTLEALSTARKRLEGCLAGGEGGKAPAIPSADLRDLAARLDALRPRASPALLARDPDLQSQVMDEVYTAELRAAETCGLPKGADLSLLLLARRDRRGEP